MSQKVFTFTFSIALAMTVFACSKRESQEVAQLRWVEVATDPCGDAKAAIAKGDHRLLAVRGLTVSIPYTESKDFQLNAAAYGIKEIQGTTDAPTSAEHRRLVRRAIDYAMAYNACVMHYYKPQSKS